VFLDEEWQAQDCTSLQKFLNSVWWTENKFRDYPMRTDGQPGTNTTTAMQHYLNYHWDKAGEWRQDQKLYCDGIWGESTNKALQCFLKIDRTGAWDEETKMALKSCLGDQDNTTWRLHSVTPDGSWNEDTTKMLQRFLNANESVVGSGEDPLVIDGSCGSAVSVCGSATYRALQHFLNHHWDLAGRWKEFGLGHVNELEPSPEYINRWRHKLQVDGKLHSGSELGLEPSSTVKSLQCFLNHHWKTAGKWRPDEKLDVDGRWGTSTTKSIQLYLIDIQCGVCSRTPWMPELNCVVSYPLP